MSAAQRALRFVIVAALEVGALIWVGGVARNRWLRIDWSDLGRWMRINPTEDVIAAFVWVAVLGCAIWLTGSSMLYAMAYASRIRALIRSVGWVTLPAVRTASERVLGAILVASTLAAPVGAAERAPVVVVDSDGFLLPPGLETEVPADIRDPVGGISPGDPIPASSVGSPVPIAAAAQTAVTVQSGDDLWAISRRHLSGLLGRRPANAETAPYWRQVVAHNRPGLISGNPDLIYPGELIELPPPG
jgi:hypothetical protein